MAKKLKLSPWHDGSVKPVHVGVYEVDNDGDGIDYFSFWNGKKWKGHWDGVEEAFKNKKFSGISSTTREWRGVLK